MAAMGGGVPVDGWVGVQVVQSVVALEGGHTLMPGKEAGSQQGGFLLRSACGLPAARIPTHLCVLRVVGAPV